MWKIRLTVALCCYFDLHPCCPNWPLIKLWPTCWWRGGVCVCVCVSSPSFVYLEQKVSSCKSAGDDLNKVCACVCACMSVYDALDALLLQFPYVQLSVVWPLTSPFGLSSADRSLVTQLWNGLCESVSTSVLLLHPEEALHTLNEKARLTQLFVSS